MSFFFLNRSNGIVNVKMVITEEKILSNIDKIQKLINPKSKKQIVKLEEDSYFKDLVESVKSYLLEYPKKNSFPTSVYSAAYSLVEYATNQFEENTRTIEELIRKREKNIKLASVLRDATKVVKANAKNWKAIVNKLAPKYSPDVAEALKVIGNAEDTKSEEYKKAAKLIDVKINNLEANLHIEIDMERIEDASKALSYIGLEIAEALKYIPAPNEDVESSKVVGKKSKSSRAEQENAEDNSLLKLAGVTKSKSPEEIDEEIEEESEEAEEYDDQEDYDEDEADEEDADEEDADEADEDEEDEADEEDDDEVEEEDVADAQEDDFEEYAQETRFEKKPSLWQRIKNSKIVRTINYILKIRVVLDYPALPEPDSNK